MSVHPELISSSSHTILHWARVKVPLYEVQSVGASGGWWSPLYVSLCGDAMLRRHMSLEGCIGDLFGTYLAFHYLFSPNLSCCTGNVVLFPAALLHFVILYL